VCMFVAIPSSMEKDESFLLKEMYLTSLTSGISRWSQMQRKHSIFGGLLNRKATRSTNSLTISAGSGGRFSVNLS